MRNNRHKRQIMKDNVSSHTSKVLYLRPNSPICLPEDMVPLVILLGPTGSGRTTQLYLLAKYLTREKDYIVEPDYMFRSQNDWTYIMGCDHFRDAIHYSHYHIDEIKDVHYMLLQVSDMHHRPICRLMELPGDYLYDPNLRQYAKYAYIYNQRDTPIRNLMNSSYHMSCPRLWIFMLEPKHWDLDDNTYRIYLDWLIDNTYPDKMMCVSPIENIQAAKSMFQRFTFEFPVVPYPKDDTKDTQILWDTILHAIERPKE